MATSPTQRTYTAPCPGCGAPVEFRSAQSAYAVCTFCQSTVVRDGETLSRIGKMGELFEDHSPLQLMAQGRWQGKVFTLVGRLQYRGASGAWTEWNVMLDAGSTALLAEDNGAYVFAVPAASETGVPEPQYFRVGATTAINGKSWQVTSNEQVALVSAQGELPKLPPLDASFAMVEMRSADNEVLSIDYGGQPPTLSRGRPVALEEMKFSGLREESGQEFKARQFACPNCGASVQVLMPDTKSVTCKSCNSLIDLEGGIGGELRHAVQDEPVQPLIPVGSKGQLQGVDWQVVGFQHRLGHEPGDEDEAFGWDEYLLYNRKRGFTFLVDSTEGWSLVRPATGAPTVSKGSDVAVYLGTSYQLKYSYKAETTYVVGEFYWPVRRGQSTFNRDYAKGKSVLSMEETPSERTWSVGSQVDADAVAKAFQLEGKKDLFGRGDAGPTAPKAMGTGCGCATIVIIIILILVLIAVLKACEDGNRGSGTTSSGSRSSSGGGGFSSGGGSHK